MLFRHFSLTSSVVKNGVIVKKIPLQSNAEILARKSKVGLEKKLKNKQKIH